MTTDRTVIPKMFDSHAASYDERWVKLAPMNASLHFLMRLALLDLPPDASILCVGAGTGAEVIALAEVFPTARITAVEPAGAMLEVCRQKAERAGIAARCTFHAGFLDSLPATGGFAAATSILVSQFLTDVDQRRGFFQEIRERLVPGGSLINADLAYPADLAARENLRTIWWNSLRFAGFALEAAKASTAGWGQGVAVLTPAEIEAILTSAGFEAPTLFHQSLFIHAWVTRTAAP